MKSFGERCYSNQYDEISDDEFSDDEISGFANTTKFLTTKFLTTKFLATKFPPPDVKNTAIDTRVLPSIKNDVRRQNSAKITSLELRSDGLHQENAALESSQKDLRSNRLHPENVNKSAQDAQKEFPRLISINNKQTNHCRENSVDSQQSDDEFGYDTEKTKTLSIE